MRKLWGIRLMIDMTEGWEIKRLGDVVKTGAGGTPKKSHKEYYEGGNIPWLLSGEVSQGLIYTAKHFITQEGLEKSSAKIFPMNTVLVAMYGATVGQVGILKCEASTNQAVCGIFPNKVFTPEFLYYFFLSKKDDLIAQAVGNAQPNISQIKIKDTKIPIPPLEEQKKIVAVLDKAFTAIDLAKANIEKNLQNAKEFFQSKLNEIFTQKGDGWEEKKLGDLGTLTSSKRIFKKEYVANGVPFYRSKEIKELAHNKSISLELFITKKRFEEIKCHFGIPKKGDILLTAVGTIGEMYVVQENEEFYFKDGNIMWLKDFQTLNTYYLKYALTSFVDQVKALSQGSAYNALTIEKLKQYSVPVPTISEQEEIVTTLDDMSKELVSLETMLQSKLRNIKDLRKSILQKAFAGELTV